MFYHNNALTSSHPYASFPIQWPFLLRGVSFWTENDTRQQIYFLGNPLGWWLTSSLLAVFAGIIGADQLALRRGLDVLDERKWPTFALDVANGGQVRERDSTRAAASSS
jgi:dolichyl-phosphate-mannose-protein mannosyltransferase